MIYKQRPWMKPMVTNWCANRARIWNFLIWMLAKNWCENEKNIFANGGTSFFPPLKLKKPNLFYDWSRTTGIPILYDGKTILTTLSYQFKFLRLYGGNFVVNFFSILNYLPYILDSDWLGAVNTILLLKIQFSTGYPVLKI